MRIVFWNIYYILLVLFFFLSLNFLGTVLPDNEVWIVITSHKLIIHCVKSPYFSFMFIKCIDASIFFCNSIAWSAHQLRYLKLLFLSIRITLLILIQYVLTRYEYKYHQQGSIFLRLNRRQKKLKFFRVKKNLYPIHLFYVLLVPYYCLNFTRSKA